MKINTDINILGGLPDWNLINILLKESNGAVRAEGGLQSHTAIKTDKSIKRFEKAISDTLLKFNSKESASLVNSIVAGELLSQDTLIMLFWNSSTNNDLLHFLNTQVYFPSFYSGRLVIKKEDVSACIKELRESDSVVREWTTTTVETVGRKYLTLLKKFNLMDGASIKTIIHPYLNDKMFVLFVYWIRSIELRPNILQSEWLKYCFSGSSVFIERVMQKKFSKFFQLVYTGDKLKIETIIPYENIYDALTQF